MATAKGSRPTEKRKKQAKGTPDDEVISAELAASKVYWQYLKDQAKRLRQLEREASGRNMEEAP